MSFMMRRGIQSSGLLGGSFDANTSLLTGSQHYSAPTQTYYQTSTLTVSAFVRITSGGVFQAIVDKQNRNSSSTQSWTMYVDTANKLSGFIRSSSLTGVTLVDPVAMVVGTWYQVGFTFDGTTFRLYKNGSQVDSSTALSDINQTTELARIGATINSSTIEWELSGSIALVDIQSIALTAPQMVTLSTATCFDDRAVNATSVGYWSLANGGDLAIGQEETDLSVNGNDLTPVGSPTYTDQSLSVECS